MPIYEGKKEETFRDINLLSFVEHDFEKPIFTGFFHSDNVDA